jgi:hypothetical protein
VVEAALDADLPFHPFARLVKVVRPLEGNLRSVSVSRDGAEDLGVAAAVDRFEQPVGHGAAWWGHRSLSG